MNGESAKTVKELVLEHDEKLDQIQKDLNQARGALYLAVLLGIINVIESIMSIAPAVAAGAMR